MSDVFDENDIEQDVIEDIVMKRCKHGYRNSFNNCGAFINGVCDIDGTLCNTVVIRKKDDSSGEEEIKENVDMLK